MQKLLSTARRQPVSFLAHSRIRSSLPCHKWYSYHSKHVDGSWWSPTPTMAIRHPIPKRRFLWCLLAFSSSSKKNNNRQSDAHRENTQHRRDRARRRRQDDDHRAHALLLGLHRAPGQRGRRKHGHGLHGAGARARNHHHVGGHHVQLARSPVQSDRHARTHRLLGRGRALAARARWRRGHHRRFDRFFVVVRSCLFLSIGSRLGHSVQLNSENLFSVQNLTKMSITCRIWLTNRLLVLNRFEHRINKLGEFSIDLN